MEKSPLFYRNKGIPPSIIAENRENHALLRKQLSHGFSERSMREQEPIIGDYVSLLIKRLHEHCAEETYSDVKEATIKKPKALDMRAWYNWTTFDIIGDLAMGEPFGCLQEAKYHPWVKAIETTIRTGAFLQTLKYLRIDGYILPILFKLLPGRKDHQRMTNEKLRRRMAMDVERPDFIEGLLKKKDDWVRCLSS